MKIGRSSTLLPAFPALLFLAVFFLLPVAEMLYGSVVGESGSLDLSAFTALGQSDTFARVLGNTVWISFLTALLCVGLGYPLAFLLNRSTARARERWLIWILVPFWTSYIVKTYAWMLLLSHTGLLTQAANGIGLGVAAIAPSLVGVLVGMVHGLLPLAVLTILPTMQGISRQLLQAAESLGASRTTGFFTVFLPLSGPGIAAGALLVFVTSLGFFIVPSLLGTPKQTMVSQLVISAVQELYDLRTAGALSVVLLACSVVILFVYDRVAGLGSLVGEGGAPAGQRGRWLPLLFALGRLFAPLARGQRPGRALPIYGLVLVLFLVLPVLLIIPIAFTRQEFVAFPPELFSLRWFREFLGSAVWREALFRSFRVGICTALLSTALGLGAAYALARRSGGTTKLLFAAFVAPLVVPRIVLAIGLLFLLAEVGLIGTDTGLVLGHTVLALPYAFVALSAGFRQFDWRLNDAARLMGASATTRLRTVVLPSLAPSLASAMLFAFITSFDDVTIAIFVSGGLNTTLPKQMWDDIQLAVTPTLAAASTLLVLLVVFAVTTASALKLRNNRNA